MLLGDGEHGGEMLTGDGGRSGEVHPGDVWHTGNLKSEYAVHSVAILLKSGGST